MNTLITPASPTGSESSNSSGYGHRHSQADSPASSPAAETSGLWPTIEVDPLDETGSTEGDWTTSLGIDSGFPLASEEKKNKRRSHGHRVGKKPSHAQLRQVKSVNTLGSKSSYQSAATSPKPSESANLEALAKESFARRRTTSGGSARSASARKSALPPAQRAAREQQSFYTTASVCEGEVLASDSSYAPASVSVTIFRSKSRLIVFRYLHRNLLRQSARD